MIGNEVPAGDGEAIAVLASEQAHSYIAVGSQCSVAGRAQEAERWFRQALRIHGQHAPALTELGLTRELQGDVDGAVGHFVRALSIDPALRRAADALGRLLLRIRPSEAHLTHWNIVVRAEPAWGLRLAQQAQLELARGRLARAATYASLHAAVRWGVRRDGVNLGRSGLQSRALTRAKLLHDIEQASYLAALGIEPGFYARLVSKYKRVVTHLDCRGLDAISIGDDEAADIREEFLRIHHVAHAPRVVRALSNEWHRDVVQKHFARSLPRLVVIDDFLSIDALKNLRRFCVQSTIWSTNRYAYGRLGSFFQDGFNAPLLLQIAEELKDKLPDIVADHPLRQIWAFKYPPEMPGGGVHADFAAISVNLWVTGNEANMTERGGGLHVFDARAPSDWQFSKYNTDGAAIRSLLATRRSQYVNIPYKENRAVIFSSDLFHATAPALFRERYEQRRVNVTLLYGDR